LFKHAKLNNGLLTKLQVVPSEIYDKTQLQLANTFSFLKLQPNSVQTSTCSLSCRSQGKVRRNCRLKQWLVLPLLFISFHAVSVFSGPLIPAISLPL